MVYTYEGLKATTNEGIIKRFLKLQDELTKEKRNASYYDKECNYYKKVLNILVESGKVSREDLDTIMKFVNI